MATKKQRKSKFDQVSYAAFLRSLKLQGLGLENVAADANRFSLSEANQDKKQLATTIEATYEIAHESEDFFIIVASYAIKQSVKESEADVFQLNCMFSAAFFSDDHDEPRRAHFSKNEAKLIFWPYLRNLVSDTTNRMAVPTILLPLTFAQEALETIAAE